MPEDQIQFPTSEEFGALLEESMGPEKKFEGRVVTGTILAIEKDYAIIDIGLKAEGRVALREFGHQQEAEEVAVGKTVEVFVDRIENAAGEAILSRERARREEAWGHLEKAFEASERIDGVIFGRVKGGFTVDLAGAVAFLPGSQVDVRPIRDVTPLFNIPQPFQILKMDRRRGNIVVSRRAVMEETRAEQRAELMRDLVEGQVVEGVVKNVTNYGAFIDLGGIDGLLHVTDMSWQRINHPSDVLNVGDTAKVQVIRINPESQRISLGIKQLSADPWEGVDERYAVGTKFGGTVTNIADYGAFIELEPGVEGLVHVSEMSWTKKNIHPGKIVSTSQTVEVMVLEVNAEKRRISLGLKQCEENPWETFTAKYPVGSSVEGEIKNITEFGFFIGLDNNVDGMVHLSDLDWQRSGEAALAEYKKGQIVKALVLDVDRKKERISLGVKQLKSDPFGQTAGKKKGSVVTCTVTAVNDNGIEVSVGDTGTTSFIRRSDLSRTRADQRPARFAVRDKVDAMMMGVDKTARRINLSIKALEISEEKAAVAQYGSTDSGASLGDILGAALRAKRDEKAKGGDSKEEAVKPKKATRKVASKAKPKKEAKDEAEPTEPGPVAEGVEAPASEVADAEPEKPKKKKAAPKSKATKTKSGKEEKANEAEKTDEI
jgi:small subunit ribosomal protein S1